MVPEVRMGMAIGVDVGGTGVRAAVVHHGHAGEAVSEPLVDRRVDTVLGSIRALVSQLDPGGCLPVGVGVPGFVRDGVVLGSPNFPLWKAVPLRERLVSDLGRHIVVENDANAATLGAWDARGDLVLLTLGTGVGGGVVSAGRLLRGAGGTGAELGHLFVGGRRRCGCGGEGCLETWVSTSGLCRSAADLGHSVCDGEGVITAADAGEGWAVTVCQQAARALGRGLVTLVNLFNPDKLVITGGLARAEHQLAAGAERWLRERAVRPSADRVSVTWEPDAQMFAIPGAAAAALAGTGV